MDSIYLIMKEITMHGGYTVSQPVGYIKSARYAIRYCRAKNSQDENNGGKYSWSHQIIEEIKP